MVKKKEELETKEEVKKSKGVVVIDINGNEIVKKNIEQAKSYIKKHGGKLKK